jgi:hypothetical protein
VNPDPGRLIRRSLVWFVYEDYIEHRRNARSGQGVGAQCGGHQAPGAAVAKHVGHLVRFQERIHRNENAPCGTGAEHRHNGLDTLVEKDGDAFAWSHTEGRQGLSESMTALQ